MHPLDTAAANRLTAQVFTSASAIPKEHWSKLLGTGSCTFSHEFWDVIERSNLAGFSDFRYVILYDAEVPVSLTAFYSVTTDIAIFAPPGLRALLSRIRSVFPNFLKLRMLECGTPITLNSPPFVAGNDGRAAAIISTLNDLLLKTARANGQFLIIIRDFESNADHMQAQLKALGYNWLDNLPNTYLNVQWATPEAYLSSMKSYYRSKVLKHVRRCEADGVQHEVADDFHDLSDTLCDQWMVVHSQADEYQREVLTPAFYREFSAQLGARSKAILFYRGGELVGHALLLLDGDLLRWLYVGRKTAANDSLYIYVAYTVIATAINLGAKRVELGLTTYAIKQDLGAQMVPLRFALRAASRLINPFVGVVYPLINTQTRIQNKNIFKQPVPSQT